MSSLWAKQFHSELYGACLIFCSPVCLQVLSVPVFSVYEGTRDHPTAPHELVMFKRVHSTNRFDTFLLTLVFFFFIGEFCCESESCQFIEKKKMC